MGPLPGVQEAPALRGSLDGQVGTLIKALTLLDCLWTELEVAGVWLWTQWAQPPEAVGSGGAAPQQDKNIKTKSQNMQILLVSIHEYTIYA